MSDNGSSGRERIAGKRVREYWLDSDMQDLTIKEIGGDIKQFRRVFGVVLRDAKNMNLAGGFFSPLIYNGNRLLSMTSLEKLMESTEFDEKFATLDRIGPQSIRFIHDFVPKARQYYSMHKL